jgi:hypothetical protein
MITHTVDRIIPSSGTATMILIGPKEIEGVEPTTPPSLQYFKPGTIFSFGWFFIDFVR